MDGLHADLPDGVEPTAIWISSVAAADVNRELESELIRLFEVTPWFAQTQARTGDLVNSYEEPERMGVDRWLAMLGAHAQVPGSLCVIDVGSATTIDLVSDDGRHEGGYILPGPALMERALLLDTDRVRFDDDVDYRLEPGSSTAEAVRHGIALAQVGAIIAIPDLSVRSLIITGGGAAALTSLLNHQFTLAPDLVFEGLGVMADLSGDI